MVRNLKPKTIRREMISLFLSLASIGLFLSACTLPKVVSTNPDTFAQISSIYASNGTLITQVPTNIVRIPIPLSQMGSEIPKAVVAIEDRRYWKRGPIDIKSTIRAALADLSAGAVVQGGSTIEEQLVKLELGTPKRTLAEKTHEILLSLGSLAGTTKSIVLDKYLNDVYLGEGTYGIQAASLRYFSLNANQLDLVQAALLAGLINAPSAYDPILHPALALYRRNQVLNALYVNSQITKQQLSSSLSAPIQLNPSNTVVNPKLGYFSETVLNEAATLPALGSTPTQRLNLIEHGGLKIVTTEVQSQQQQAQKAVLDGIPNSANMPSGALVSINPANGAIEALVGGPGYNSGKAYSQFNMATQAQRPSGSTFKVIALAEALTQGFTAKSVFYAPKVLYVAPANHQSAWVVHNYEGEPTGYMTLLAATALSVNTVYAQLITKIGPANVVSMAHAMGIKSPLLPYNSIVLGAQPVTPLDMASVNATLADYGTYNAPYSISAIYDSSGKLIYSHVLHPKQVLSPTIAATEIQILTHVMTEGTGVNASLYRPAAGKTGTGENWADAWFAGFVPQLATVVWVGYPSGEVPMIPPTTPIYVTGGSWPARIFAQYMTSALAASPIAQFRTPASFAVAPPVPTTTSPPKVSTTVTTPSTALTNVIGMPVSLAESTLSGQGFKVSLSFAPSSEYPPGYAISQSPSPGVALAKDATIDLTVAKGTLTYPSIVVVPNLLGLTASQANETISSVSLSGSCTTNQQTGTSGANQTPQAVWEQSPIPGTQVPLGSTITCYNNP